MSEPLDPLTLQRLADTEAAKARVRTVDLPTEGSSNLLGTLHIQPRAPARRVFAQARCTRCREMFQPVWPAQKHCSDACFAQAARTLAKNARARS